MWPTLTLVVVVVVVAPTLGEVCWVGEGAGEALRLWVLERGAEERPEVSTLRL